MTCESRESLHSASRDRTKKHPPCLRVCAYATLIYHDATWNISGCTGAPSPGNWSSVRRKKWTDLRDKKKPRPLSPARVLMNLSVGMLRSRPLLVRASPMDCQAPRQKLRRNTPTHLPPCNPQAGPRFAAPTPTRTTRRAPPSFSTRETCAFHDSVKRNTNDAQKCVFVRMYTRLSRDHLPQRHPTSSRRITLIHRLNAKKICDINRIIFFFKLK